MGGIAGLAERLGVEPIALVGAGFGFGVMLLLASFFLIARDREKARVLARLRAESEARPQVMLTPETAADGFLDKVFVPAEAKERGKLRRDLEIAGLRGQNAALAYNLVRFGIGLGLPAVIAFLYFNPGLVPLPDAVADRLYSLRTNQITLGCSALIVAGFYGPALWLSARVSERRSRIELAFPNALDLLQVGVEAGMAFDAALARVADELDGVAPEICSEFRIVQQEILAGRPREAAYRDMADRLGIEEAYGFANVVMQSMRFGTSISSALLTYSAEMRQRRELRAQEKANRLPVLMSAVMATLMMPALLIVTIGPVVLRYMAGF